MGWNLSPTLSEELANLEKDDDSRKAAMKSLKLYVKNMDSEAVPRFLAEVSEINKAGLYQYGMYIIPLFEVLARVQGPKIVSQLENIMSVIIETVKKTHLHEECSKVIPAIVRYGIEPTTPEDKKRRIIGTVCKPLSDCLLSSEEGVSCGAALCLKKLVDCDNWRFASNEMVNEVCLKLAGANETESYTGLVMSLAKKNSFVVEAYARLLVEAGLRILRRGLSERSSQKCSTSVRMLHSLMKYLNRKSIFSELELIIEELEECVSDHFENISGAFEALQTAKKLLANDGVSIANSDVVSVSGSSEWSNVSSRGSRSPSSGSPKSHVSSDCDEKSGSWESYTCGFPGLLPENRPNGGLRSRTPSPQRTDSQLNIDSIKIYTTPRKLLHSFQDEEDDDDDDEEDDSVHNKNVKEYRRPVTRYGEHGHFTEDSVGNLGNGCENYWSDYESVSSTEDMTINDVFSHQKFHRGEKHSPRVAKNYVWKIAKMLLVFLAIFIVSAVLLSDDQDRGYSHHTLVPT